MLIMMMRTLIMFLVVVVALRLMGKRQIGKLQPYELVIIIMISELASIPMQNVSIPLVAGFVPIFILLLLQVVLSLISLHSEWARGFVCGRPSILIRNGKIVEEELARSRYNINDLLEQLRIKNFPNIAQVEFAILETGGELSVIPKSQHRPLSPADMSLPTKYEGLPVPLIIDGYLDRENLRDINLTEEWLLAQLARQGISDYKQVLYASIDTQGNFFCQRKVSKKAGALL